MKKYNNLFFEEYGEDNKEIIIFLHSNLLSNWIWKHQKNSFKDYKCFYLDIPEHGNSQFNEDFSIEKSGEIIKKFIEKKTNGKKVHLVGIALGGQIALYLLAKYSELIDTIIVSGVNLQKNFFLSDDNKNKELNNDLFNEKLNEKIKNISEMLKFLKKDILDNKPENFIIKGYLAEYGLEKKYFNDLKKSIESISENNCLAITEESLKFKIPEVDDVDKDYNKKLLILYGTKEYPKIIKSSEIIENSFNNAQIFSIERAIHLWNIHNYSWFNDIIEEFISTKNLDLSNKSYLKKIN